MIKALQLKGFEPYFILTAVCLLCLAAAIAWPYGWEVGERAGISSFNAAYMMERGDER